MQLDKNFCRKIFRIAAFILGTFMVLTYLRAENRNSNKIQTSDNLNENVELPVHNFKKFAQNKADLRPSPQSIKRKKRFVLFNDGGVVKLVLGVSYPILLADPMRSLSMFYNWHLQYMPPPIPLYAWSLYNTTTFPAKRKRHSKHAKSLRRDFSREFIYEAIMAWFESENLPGKACLLKTICEISANPFHVPAKGNIFHEFLNAIFIPSIENVDAAYWNAYNVGHHGAVCDYTCPTKINWLERNTIFF